MAIENTVTQKVSSCTWSRPALQRESGIVSVISAQKRPKSPYREHRRGRACSATLGAGERLEDRVACIRPQAAHRFAARPDFQNIRGPRGERLIALRRANHPGWQSRGLNLLRLLLDSRGVDLPMAYNPTFVIFSSLKPLFFNSLKNELRFSDNVGA
jgi:hypothetical protein